LRTLIQTSGVYQKRLVEYLDFRGIERKLLEMEERFEHNEKSTDAQNP